MLAKVNFPEDIRHFSLGELNRLAGEIREVMIGTVSRRGGHPASSPRTGELTPPLPPLLDPPRGRPPPGWETRAPRFLAGGCGTAFPGG